MAMRKADPQVEAKIREAVVAGATDKLRALASQFPDSFEALRDEDLVDLAVQHKKAGAALYLILAHGFETSTMFEYEHRAFLGELFAEGVNQYHTTLEVMASAAMNFAHEAGRSLACYGTRDFVSALCENRTPLPMHPEFHRAAANGDLARFVEKFSKDERYQRCCNRHTGQMLRTLKEHGDLVSTYARDLLRDAAGEVRQPGRQR